jgi:hypothetical protein
MSNLTAWLKQRASGLSARASPPNTTPTDTSLLHTQCSDILFASGDAALGDPESSAILARLVARHVESLLALTLDAAAATVAVSSSSGGGAATTISPGPQRATLDGSTVVEVLRASGATRSAAAVATTLKAHKRLAPLLSLDISSVEETTAAYSLWKEKPPEGVAARGSAAAKARFLDTALTDKYVALPP